MSKLNDYRDAKEKYQRASVLEEEFSRWYVVEVDNHTMDATWVTQMVALMDTFDKLKSDAYDALQVAERKLTESEKVK